MAAPPGQLRVGRYFIALAAIVAILYALVFFTGTTRTPKLGLDLQGGTTITLKAVTKNGQAPPRDQLNEARSIIDQRVNGLGVAEAEVVTQGNSQIVISLPGKNDNDIRDRVAGTAQLRFRQVIQEGPSTPAPPQPTPSASASPAPGASASKAPAVTPASPTPSRKRALTSAIVAPTPTPTPAKSSTSLSPSASASPPSDQATLQAAIKFALTQPADIVYASPGIGCDVLKRRPPGSTDDPKKKQVACDSSGTTKFLLDVSKVLGTDVGSANYAVNPNSPAEWEVNLSFTGKGQSRWTKLTKDAFGKTSPNDQVAIVLDGVVVSAPQILGTIAGDAQITGSFTQKQAQGLANQLKYGALPLTFSTSNSQTVSPTLGTDQLKAGMLAGGIGLLLVVVYSLLYYRLLGLVTIVSLVLSGVVTYACVVLLGRQIGFTLTLAGIAGFIVAVGITADSFVVFFERVKDEVKDGRSVRSAVPRAWVRARRTILSADAVSFLAAAALYIFTVGAVRGFAFTLGLSTILDLVIVFLFTHPLVSSLSGIRGFDSPRMTGLGNVRHRDPALVTGSGRGLGATATASPKES